MFWLLLGIFVWLFVGYYASSVYAHIAWDDFGDVLGFERHDRVFLGFVVIFGPINFLALLVFSTIKGGSWKSFVNPLWNWKLRPPRNPDFLAYWQAENKK